MPDTYITPTRAAHKRMAQRFALDAADGLRTEATLTADHTAGLIAMLRGSGAGSLSVGAVKDALSDAFGDIQGCLNRTLDGEGLATDRHQIDTSELEAA